MRYKKTDTDRKPGCVFYLAAISAVCLYLGQMDFDQPVQTRPSRPSIHSTAPKEPEPGPKVTATLSHYDMINDELEDGKSYRIGRWEIPEKSILIKVNPNNPNSSFKKYRYLVDPTGSIHMVGHGRIFVRELEELTYPDRTTGFRCHWHMMENRRGIGDYIASNIDNVFKEGEGFSSVDEAIRSLQSGILKPPKKENTPEKTEDDESVNVL